MFEKIGLHLQVLLTTIHSIVKTIGRPYAFSEGMTNCALPITITKSGEV
jgi:hypothetical protein